jgi:hypothetical protein
MNGDRPPEKPEKMDVKVMRMLGKITASVPLVVTVP